MSVTTRLGEFELLTRLASGGMAEIYAARSVRSPDNVVIIKQMLPQFSDNAEFVEMFLDEGRTISLLKHPNIVRMHSFGFHDEHPFLALEYLHGVNVRAIMRAARAASSRIPLDASLAIISGLCAGLHHAHEATSLEGYPMDIVHRDVSPQNVVVTFEGVVKLIDFGIAKSRGRIHETKVGALKGKLHYMAPEQVRGSGVERRSDIYAAGVMLYELVTGRRPYVIDKGDAPKGDFSLMMAIVAHRIARPTAIRPDLPPALEQIILRALSARVDGRFATARAMQEAIEAAARDLGLATGPSPLARVLERLFGPQQAPHPGKARKEEAATAIVSLEKLRSSGSDDQDPTGIEATELEADEPPAAAARDATMEVRTQAVADVTTIALEPRLDERFHGAARAAELVGSVVLDLSSVERISSFGVREWLELHRALEDRPDVELYFARCSEAIVTQLGMMRAFVGRAHVVSFQAPYLCTACGRAFVHTFDCELDAGELRQGNPPIIPCIACEGAATLDDDRSYLAPVLPHLGKPLPARVRSVVARLSVEQMMGSVLEKQVNGQTTRLRFVRAIAATFRWGRLLDGLEGDVELDLTSARLDPRMVDATALALRAVGRDVRSLDVYGAPASLAALLDEASRCTVRTVALEGRCPNCAAVRATSISLVELRELVAGNRVTITCRRCDSPLVDLDALASRHTTGRVDRSRISSPALPTSPRVRRVTVIVASAAVVLGASAVAYVALWGMG